MKVRMSDQSLRIRISAAEAQCLYNGDVLRTELRLNPIDVFAVELQSWNLAIGEVNTGDKSLILSIPHEASQHLVDQRGYSFTGEQSAHTSTPLTFSVEIDLEKASQP